MKRGIAVAVGVGAFLIATMTGLTVAVGSTTATMAADFDMPPAQVEQFIQTGATKLGWTKAGDGFQAPLLPWKSGEVTAQVTAKGNGSRVTLGGAERPVHELENLLKRQLPPLRQ